MRLYRKSFVVHSEIKNLKSEMELFNNTIIKMQVI